MRILVAEDDTVTRRMLEATLLGSGNDVLSVEDGTRAWELLQTDAGIRLAILDWLMPGIDGIELCRRIRQRTSRYTYVIILTMKDRKEDIVVGLDAGADDYITKPFYAEELHSRIRAGRRIVELETRLEEKVQELGEALAHVRRLQGLLPICMHCKKIRDDRDTWHRLEHYIQEHSDALFTHSLCEECARKHYAPVLEKVGRKS